MSFAFLTTGAAAAPARSPMARQAAGAGARFETRDGWSVAVAYAGEAGALQAVGFADVSHLPKWELCGALPPGLEPGTATTDNGSTWLPMTRDRALVLGARPGEAALEVTSAYGALRIAGPLARETCARFTALDLRPRVCPPGAWRPGSVARTPGGILCEAEDRYLMLFGAALGQYMWTVVDDVARYLGGGPVGADVLAREEAAAGA